MQVTVALPSHIVAPSVHVAQSGGIASGLLPPPPLEPQAMIETTHAVMSART